MNHTKITKVFLDYFKKNKHKIIPGASIIPPEDDPSSLFTTSGMHPLKPYFLGKLSPPAKRLANIQECIRTGDIDDVGNDGRHLTFFFMLGNWSIGDYWKEDACSLAFGLLTKGFKLEKNKLWASVFAGDKELNLSKDEEVIKIWEKVGIPRSRQVLLPAEDNFWAGGPTGPCGPTSEVFYDRGKKFGCGKSNCKPGCSCDRFLEIWNPCVQIAYNRDEKGVLHNLPMKSIDAGAGLERIATLLQKKDSVFETTLFEPILKKLEKLSKKYYSEYTRQMRIILDHLRACCFIITAGIEPGRVEKGYVLRRLLRRMIFYGRNIGLKFEDYLELARVTNKIYPEINIKKFENVFADEFNKFDKTLARGLVQLSKLICDCNNLSAKDSFMMYDTYGFPLELTKELCFQKGVKVDEKGFYACFEKHKEVSKGGSEQRFKSGLSLENDATTRLHTATHLLNAALQKIVSRDIYQKGSNITPERLRFDFPSKENLTPEQLKKVEDQVNEWIHQSIPVCRDEMSVKEAKDSGAHGVFDERYGSKVSVYTVGATSKEICAGPHVKNTSELGKFKIVKQESIGAGIKRIKAVLD